MPSDIDLIKRFTQSAQELGALQASGIWALFSLTLVAYIVWDKKQSKRRDEIWQDIRIKEAMAEVNSAQALNKMGDAYERLVDKISEISVILDERIPRR